MSTIHITYFSDVLCVWAYVAQPRLEELKLQHGQQIALEYRFCSVFGDAHFKLDTAWRERDGFAGYARHVQGVVERFGAPLHPETWLRTRPASSMSPHLFLRAIMDWEREQVGPAGALERSEQAIWALRKGFFADGHDIARHQVQRALVAPLGIDLDAVEHRILSGSAFASLAADYHDAEKSRVEGSPTFILNNGRQKLYGNVGFRILDANIRELMRHPNADEASWC